MQGDFIYMLTYFGTLVEGGGGGVGGGRVVWAEGYRCLIPLTKRALLLFLRVLDSHTVREFI